MVSAHNFNVELLRPSGAEKPPPPPPLHDSTASTPLLELSSRTTRSDIDPGDATGKGGSPSQRITERSTAAASTDDEQRTDGKGDTNAATTTLFGLPDVVQLVRRSMQPPPGPLPKESTSSSVRLAFWSTFSRKQRAAEDKAALLAKSHKVSEEFRAAGWEAPEERLAREMRERDEKKQDTEKRHEAKRQEEAEKLEAKKRVEALRAQHLEELRAARRALGEDEDGDRNPVLGFFDAIGSAFVGVGTWTCAAGRKLNRSR